MALQYRTDRRPDPQPIKGVRVLRGITNQQLARMIGRSPTWTCTVLNGWEQASEAFMQDAAEALGVPLDDLFRPGGRDGF